MIKGMILGTICGLGVLSAALFFQQGAPKTQEERAIVFMSTDNVAEATKNANDLLKFAENQQQCATALADASQIKLVAKNESSGIFGLVVIGISKACS